MTFRLGCAVWAYPGWLGTLFPKGSRSRDFLALYSRRFVTVEGNTTFYAIPDRATLDRWFGETPDDFEFCLKLPRHLTHDGLLMPHLAAARDFLQHVRHLGRKLGVVFVQLPPSYSPAQFDDLAAFLSGLSQAQPDVRLGLEVRHRHWFREPHGRELNDLLRDRRIGRVLLDARPVYSTDDDPQAKSHRRKPNSPFHPVITADFAFVRLIAHPNAEVNRPFLVDWVNLLESWLVRGTQVYFFVHCPVEEQSPLTARSLQHLLEERAIAVPPLPWNELDEPDPPVQLSLFE